MIPGEQLCVVLCNIMALGGCHPLVAEHLRGKAQFCRVIVGDRGSNAVTEPMGGYRVAEFLLRMTREGKIEAARRECGAALPDPEARTGLAGAPLVAAGRRCSDQERPDVFEAELASRVMRLIDEKPRTLAYFQRVAAESTPAQIVE